MNRNSKKIKQIKARLKFKASPLTNKACPKCGYFESVSASVLCLSCQKYTAKHERWTQEFAERIKTQREKEAKYLATLDRVSDSLDQINEHLTEIAKTPKPQF